MLARPIVVAAALSGCYRPSVAPCQLDCFDQQCPESLVCNTENHCVAALGDTCVPNDALASSDGVAVDAAVQHTCGFHASNIDPCTFGQPTADLVTADWVITANETVDTTAGTVKLGTASALPTGALAMPSAQRDPNGPEVFVIAVHDLTLQSGQLTVTGSRPLVILASGSVTVASTAQGISLKPSSVGACPWAGLEGIMSGGGGGGGLGTDGGGGGGVASHAPGGVHAPTSTNIPLRMGCRGGTGDAGGTNSPGAAGSGGGALQISAAGTLSVQATLAAPGAGGGVGSGGGGGGGAGGAILLEAASVTLGPSSSVCANGGGGGGASGPATAGAGGGCSAVAARGGTGTTVGGTGGAGTLPGGPGDDGMPGAGGGGGVGIIRVNTANPNSSAVVESPPISFGPSP